MCGKGVVAVRRGSSLSDKQLVVAIRERKSVSAFMPSGRQVQGWVIGFDDYHIRLAWAAEDGELITSLFHKTAIEEIRVVGSGGSYSIPVPVISLLEQAVSWLDREGGQ